ncbi:MAG: DNA polymerase I, partial [Acidobacteriota bacterium]
ISGKRRRLWLVDGTANIFRAYYALRGGFTTRDGTPTNAVYGFTSMLRKLLREEEPEYLGICFDRGEPTFRHEEYPAYKANRPEPPEDLIEQFPLVKEITEAYRIPALDLGGWEADDLLGTLAHRAVVAGLDVIIVASDKDLFQLVNDHVKILNPYKDHLLMDAAVVEEQFGVPPERVVDLLALMGDSSDNIPGVPGIGAKGARQLLAEFGSLDALLDRANEVKRRSYRESLLANREKAELSRRLATIRLDAPVRLDLETLKRAEPDEARLKDLFSRLEFSSFLKELQETADTAGASYRLVTTLKDLKAVLRKARDRGRLSVDLETTGVDPMRAEILGVALCSSPGEAVYVPVRHEVGAGGVLAREKLFSLLRPVLEDPALGKVGQNLKYEYVLFRRAGIRMQGIHFDSMIAAYLLNPSRSHKLDDLAAEYLDYRMIPYTDLAGKGAKQITLDQVDLKRVVEYAAEDADIALRLADLLGEKLTGCGLNDLFRSLEIPLLPILAEMEFMGVRLDVDHLARISDQMEDDLSRIEAQIHAEAGREFNINSPKQLGEVLFREMGIAPSRKTARSGTFSTSQPVLEELAVNHPICAKVLEWRSLAKLKGTYADALPALVHPETGRLHTSFNQTVASTGRLSSSNPNLQNIPVRTSIGREIRRAFIPAEGFVLLTADYSQVELRILAHLTEDPVLCEAFRHGEDIHARTAAEIFGVDRNLVTDEMRRRAKTINFGILYGMGPQRLAREQGINLRQAQAFIKSYFDRFKRVKAYIEETSAFAQKEGYVRTLLDRVRFFPELKAGNRMARQQALRAAVNTTIQGTAADLIKKAMIDIDRRLSAGRLRSRMLIQVHDELVLEVPRAEIDAVSGLVKEAMEAVHTLAVPLTVEIGWGPNWLEAKPG